MNPLELLNIGGKILDKIIPDPAARDAAKLQLLKLQQDGELAGMHDQVQVNMAEAANPSLFVSGWRPAVGWMCALGFGYSVLLRPLLAWLSVAHGWEVPPAIDTSELIGLLFGMLGLGTLRTVERVKGGARL